MILVFVRNLKSLKLLEKARCIETNERYLTNSDGEIKIERV